MQFCNPGEYTRIAIPCNAVLHFCHGPMAPPLNKPLVVDHKITIRQTINFSGTKTVSIQAEDLFSFFLWSSHNFGHKNRSISGRSCFVLLLLFLFFFLGGGLHLISDTKTALIQGEFPEKVRTRQHFCAQKPQKIRGNIAKK